MNDPIDSFPGLAQELSDAETSASRCIAKWMRENAERLKNVEFFLAESPYNRYQPAPPEGWQAIRSQKRRIFLKEGQLIGGVNDPTLEELLRRGDARELPLCKAFDEP